MKKISVFAVFLFFCITGGTAWGQQYQYQYDPAEEEPAAPPSSYPYEQDSGRRPIYDRPSTGYPSSPSYRRDTAYPSYRREIYPTRLSDPYPRYSVEVNGNASAFEARLGLRRPLVPNSVFFGLGGITSDKDFYLLSAELAYGNRLLEDRLSLDIGLKGMWGEGEKGPVSANIGAVGLMIRAEYNLPDIEITYDRYLDLELFGELSMSPEPLTFADGETILDSRFGLNINLAQNKRSAIILGYRYIRMEFEEKEDWDKSDKSAYIGFRIRF